MVRLAGIVLPDDIQWMDEFNGWGVGQIVQPTLTGALVVQETIQPVGRRITLSSNGAAWVTRSTVESLTAIAATPLNNGTLLLEWADGRSFDVVIDRDAGGFVAEEVMRLGAGAQDSNHYYQITINLITA